MRPRVRLAAEDWVGRYISKYEKPWKEKLDRTLSRANNQRQSHFATLYVNVRSLALLLYGVGRPINEIREIIHKAGRVYLEVLARRGEPVRVFKLPEIANDPTKSFDIGKAMDEGRLPHEEVSDYSIGNSWSSLQALWLMLCIRDDDVASQIADKIWDPEDAPYVGANSDVCTPDQQRLAYTTRDWWLNRADRTEETSRVLASSDDDLRLPAELLRHVSQGDSKGFLSALSALVTMHEQAALIADKSHEVELMFSVRATAMAAVGVCRRVIAPSELPDNPFLPIKLFLDEP